MSSYLVPLPTDRCSLLANHGQLIVNLKELGDGQLIIFVFLKFTHTKLINSDINFDKSDSILAKPLTSQMLTSNF